MTEKYQSLSIDQIWNGNCSIEQLFFLTEMRQEKWIYKLKARDM